MSSELYDKFARMIYIDQAIFESEPESNLEIEQYKASLNRSYYAVFHAMCSVNALKNFDPSKHSGVIAYLKKEYLRTEILDRSLAIIIKESSVWQKQHIGAFD